MAEIVVGSAVLSKAGRDKGRYFAVLALADGFAEVADGDLRKIAHPKRKKLRHLGATNVMFQPEQMISDKTLYRAISARFSAAAMCKEV